MVYNVRALRRDLRRCLNLFCNQKLVAAASTYVQHEAEKSEIIIVNNS